MLPALLLLLPLPPMRASLSSSFCRRAAMASAFLAWVAEEATLQQTHMSTKNKAYKTAALASLPQ
jgi:hypothetical protein